MILNWARIIFYETSKAQEQKQKLTSGITYKLKSTAKETVNRVKDNLQNGRKYLQTIHLTQQQQQK
jgi:hypothetical protein